MSKNRRSKAPPCRPLLRRTSPPSLARRTRASPAPGASTTSTFTFRSSERCAFSPKDAANEGRASPAAHRVRRARPRPRGRLRSPCRRPGPRSRLPRGPPARLPRLGPRGARARLPRLRESLRDHARGRFARAARHRTRAGARLPRAERATAERRPGWHFLPGAAAAAALAETVGFRYAFEASSGQFAHPAGFIVLTPQGEAARYFMGVRFDPAELRSAIA